MRLAVEIPTKASARHTTQNIQCEVIRSYHSMLCVYAVFLWNTRRHENHVNTNNVLSCLYVGWRIPVPRTLGIFSCSMPRVFIIAHVGHMLPDVDDADAHCAHSQVCCAARTHLVGDVAILVGQDKTTQPKIQHKHTHIRERPPFDSAEYLWRRTKEKIAFAWAHSNQLA